MSDYSGDHKSYKPFHSRIDAIYKSLKDRLDARKANNDYSVSSAPRLAIIIAAVAAQFTASHQVNDNVMIVLTQIISDGYLQKIGYEPLC